MRHDERSHQSGTYAPRGCPSIFGLVLLVEELHLEGFTKVLSEEVTGSALQSLTILHHSFDGISVECTSEALRLTLNSLNHRHCHIVLSKLCIDLEHLLSTLLSLFSCSMSRMSFLPKELACTEEETSSHLPPHYITPLIYQERKVAITLNPILESVPNDGFRSGTNDEFLFQFGCRINHNSIMRLVCLETIVSYYGTLLSKAFHMLRFLREETLGNEQGEISILNASLLEHIVEGALHLLPNCITVRLDDHAAANVALLGQIGLYHQFVVPFAVVLASLCEEVQFFCHIAIFIMSGYVSKQPQLRWQT